eukprot:COSAG06_NODE_1887_length_8141_cov_11.312609_4_plen_153_part_00
MRFLTAEAGVSAADLAPAPPPPPPVNAGYVPAPEEVRTCYDFDENGIVGIADLLSLLSAFGTSGCLDSEPDALHCGYDGTADGVVGVQDLRPCSRSSARRAKRAYYYYSLAISHKYDCSVIIPVPAACVSKPICTQLNAMGLLPYAIHCNTR